MGTHARCVWCGGTSCTCFDTDAEYEEEIRRVADQETKGANVGQDPTRLILVRYTNHRGDTQLRRIEPHTLWFGTTPWHPEPQWLVHVFDREKQEWRDFALLEMARPTPEEAAEWMQKAGKQASTPAAC